MTIVGASHFGLGYRRSHWKQCWQCKVKAKSSKKPVFTENYSFGRNKLGNQHPDKKPPKKSIGRHPADPKEHLVSDLIEVFPQGVQRDRCIHRGYQAAWRIVDGTAVCPRYDIRDLADSTNLPLPPGVRNSHSECGVDAILILGFLHYWIIVPQENAIQIVNYFTDLELAKSQAEVTSVPCDFFDGIGVTDDYAAYENLFSVRQLRWADLIRKAIKLVLQNPDETEYAELLDQLRGIYDDAKELRNNVAASVVGEPLNQASERKAVVTKLREAEFASEPARAKRIRVRSNAASS